MGKNKNENATQLRRKGTGNCPWRQSRRKKKLRGVIYVKEVGFKPGVKETGS